jgi:Icc-related predicted phosphoesterase
LSFAVAWVADRPSSIGSMRLLAFSDLHCDIAQAALLVDKSAKADAVVAVGDLATVHRGLDRTITALAAIKLPTLLVPGNNETADALRASAENWDSATVLHGESANIDGIEFFGLGAGIPTTPWDWSFDLDEDEAREALEPCPDGAVLLVHSPPFGHVDSPAGGGHLGSQAILEAVEAHAPPLVLCGHIHESWGHESKAGSSRVMNLGPWGSLVDV